MRALSLTAALVVITAASYGQKTGYNFDQQADFSKYKTYKWVELKGGGHEKLSEIARRNVTDALEKAMAKRGLTKVDTDSADLMAGYQVGFEQEQEYTTFNSGGPWGYGGGWGPGWGWGYGGGGISQTTSQTIVTGTLVLDMYDREAKRLVWRGQVSDTVDPTRSPEKRLKKLDKAVEKMVKNYPPKKKG